MTQRGAENPILSPSTPFSVIQTIPIRTINGAS